MNQWCGPELFSRKQACHGRRRLERMVSDVVAKDTAVVERPQRRIVSDVVAKDTAVVERPQRRVSYECQTCEVIVMKLPTGSAQYCVMECGITCAVYDAPEVSAMCGPLCELLVYGAGSPWFVCHGIHLC